MAGARVGFTADAPDLIEGRYAVEVQLKLKNGVKIPRGSTFVISSSGFLGDAFVSINPPSKPNLDDLLKDGEYVVGTRVEGLGDLTAKGSEVMTELKKRLEELEAPIKDIRDRVLAEKNLKSIDESFASLSEFTGNLKNTSKGLDDVIARAKEAADSLKDTLSSAKPTMEKIDSAAGDLKATLAQIRGAAATADKALESARTLINKANSGKGAIGMLLADKETADNLKALIRNLREHGVLWYKNRTK
jgi:phospholipid/cholesterol/gamma-HCH transport system substrate-binding protein